MQEEDPSGAHGLTPKQARFIEEYLRDRNATQAAIRAGFSIKSAGRTGWELLHAPKYRHVQQALSEASRDLSRNTQEIQEALRRRWTAIATHDLRAVLPEEGERFSMDQLRELPPETMACIREIKQNSWIDADGVTQTQILVKFYSALEAGKLLGTHLGMLRQQVDLGGSLDFEGARDAIAGLLDKLMASRGEIARAAARALARAQKEATRQPDAEGGPGA